MKVVLLTEPEKDSLVGELVQPDWYFNPVLDCNGNWIISTQEVDNSIYSQHEWIKSMHSGNFIIKLIIEISETH